MYSHKIWDKVTPINGVAAADVLKIHNITKGAVGIVSDDKGHVVVLQYDNANPLSKADLTAKLKLLTKEMNKPTLAEPEVVEND